MLLKNKHFVFNVQSIYFFLFEKSVNMKSLQRGFMYQA